jgi:hypothetical protein
VVLLGELVDERKITVSGRIRNRSEPMEINPLTGQLRYYRITYDFDVEFVFLGHHFNKLEEIQFEEILVKYSHINAWIHDPEMNGFLSKK